MFNKRCIYTLRFAPACLDNSWNRGLDKTKALEIAKNVKEHLKQ